MNRRTQYASQAFTLAELLIAIAITALIVVMLGRVFTAAASQWQTAEQRIDAFRDARAALQIMARDLSRAHLDGDPQMLKLSNYAADSGGNQYAKEAYVVAPMANSGKSDLCAAGYYLSWDGSAKAYRMKRLFRDSDTSIGLLAKTSPDFDKLFEKASGNEEDLAAYVWDLRFRPGTLGDPEAPSANPSTKWQWIEVRFKAMSPASAAKLRNMAVSEATWADPTNADYKRLILPYEQQFVTRIKVHHAP